MMSVDAVPAYREAVYLQKVLFLGSVRELCPVRSDSFLPRFTGCGQELVSAGLGGFIGGRFSFSGRLAGDAGGGALI